MSNADMIYAIYALAAGFAGLAVIALLMGIGYWSLVAKTTAIASSLEFARADNLKLSGDLKKHLRGYDAAIKASDSQHDYLGGCIDKLRSDNQRTFNLQMEVIVEHQKWLSALSAPAEPSPEPVDLETSLRSSVLDAALVPEHSPRS